MLNFIKKVFSPSFLFFSIFLLTYTFYKSEIVWSGNKIDYYRFYYILSILLIATAIISFFINEKIKSLLIKIIFFLFFLVYLIEFCIISYDGFVRTLTHYLKEGKSYDTRSILDIYNNLKQNDSQVKLIIRPQSHLKNTEKKLLPLSGISNSKTIHCIENGYYSIYQSDRYGFNNPDSEWDEKEIEYLTLGDSFVQGSCVNRPNDITSVLRTLSNKSAVNLGYGLNGPLLQYAGLREYLSKNVKNVLWFYYEGDDLFNLEISLKSKILNKYISDLSYSQNLKKLQPAIDNLNELNMSIKLKNNIKYESEISKSKIINFIKLYSSRSKFFSKSDDKVLNKTEFSKILTLAKNLTLKNNSKFYFVYLPEYSRYKSDYDNTDYHEVKKIVKQLQIPFIDIHAEVFEKEKNPLNLFPFKLKGHYNIEGYKKIGVKISEITNTLN